MLSQADQDRITAAVAAAEEGSSGDIFCVLAGEVSSYREVPIAWGAAAALIVPPAALAAAYRPLLAAFTGGWTAAGANALPHQLGFVLTAYVVVQICVFGLVALIASLAPVRRLVTPAFLKRHRVKKAAAHHFLAAHAHASPDDEGADILIFVALVDRQVQVLADPAIHQKTGEALWRSVADAVKAGMRSPDPTAGVEKAIALCGEALKRYVPSDRRGGGVDRPTVI